MRPTANPVAVVGGKGTVKDAGLHDTHFVEGGGRVVPMGENGLYFVKNGGRIEGPHTRALVFHKPRAQVSIGGPNTNAVGDPEFQTVNLRLVATAFLIVPPSVFLRYENILQTSRRPRTDEHG